MNSKSKKVVFETLGCRLNHSESEILKRDLLQRGYQIAGEEDSADLCVVNTCTVTEQGDAKNRQLIRSLHRSHPKASIAVVGCYAQMDGNRISEIPGVRLVLGNEEKMNLPDHINGLEQEARNQVLIPRIKRGSFPSSHHPQNRECKRIGWLRQCLGIPNQGFIENPGWLRFHVFVLHHPFRKEPFSLSGFQQPDGGSPTTE